MSLDIPAGDLAMSAEINSVPNLIISEYSIDDRTIIFENPHVIPASLVNFAAQPITVHYLHHLHLMRIVQIVTNVIGN
jgi:hypothetical protein